MTRDTAQALTFWVAVIVCMIFVPAIVNGVTQ